MGKLAEMHLDGTLCECCGIYLGVSDGYPVRCAECGANPGWHGAVIGYGALAGWVREEDEKEANDGSD